MGPARLERGGKLDKRACAWVCMCMGMARLERGGKLDGILDLRLGATELREVHARRHAVRRPEAAPLHLERVRDLADLRK